MRRRDALLTVNENPVKRRPAPLRGAVGILAVLVLCGAWGCSRASEDAATPAEHGDTTPVSSQRRGGKPAPSESPGGKKWATRIEKAGLPNLHRVTEDLYRGAQPTAEGFRELKAMGIRTVVNLRSFHSDRDELGDLDLGYEHITMKAWHAEDKEAVRFLKIVTDKEKLPVFVHCQHGADRTGTVCAIYRVAVCGWSKEEAVREMTEGGFGFHGVWQNLARYVRRLPNEEIKRRAGLRE